MVDVEKEMMKEIMADYHSGDPRKVASAKEQREYETFSVK